MARTKTKPGRRQPAAASGSSLRWMIGFLIAVVAAAVVWKLRDRPSVVATDTSTAPADIPLIDPPEVDIEQIDKAVAAAIRRDQQAVREAPRSAEAWGNLAMTLYTHEYTKAAAICLAHTEAREPGNAQWPYLLGKATQDEDAAIEALERAVSLCGNDPAAPRLTLVERLLELYRLDDAERHLAGYLAEFNADPRARMAQARLAFMRDDAAGCLQQLEQLRDYMQRNRIQRHKNHTMLLMMAEALRRLGRIDEAEATRQQAMDVKDGAWFDPYASAARQRRTGLKTHLIKADRMFGRREYDQSIDLLRTTIADYPESIWGRILLARALIRTGAPDSRRSDSAQRLSEAEEMLNRVLEQDSTSVEALFRLGVCKGYQGDLAGAIRLYRQAVEVKPDFTMAYFNLANALRRQGDLDGATEALRGAIASEPEFANGHYWLGDSLMRLGQLETAEEHFATAVRLNPNQPEMRKALMRVQRLRANSQLD